MLYSQDLTPQDTAFEKSDPDEEDDSDETEQSYE